MDTLEMLLMAQFPIETPGVASLLLWIHPSQPAYHVKTIFKTLPQSLMRQKLFPKQDIVNLSNITT